MRPNFAIVNLGIHTHTGFRLIPKVEILNGVMAVMLGYFAKFGSFGANYVTVAV